MSKATRLRSGDLETATRTYQRDGRKVTLIGVTHIADHGFWDGANYLIDGLGCEVHFEGIGAPKTKADGKLGVYGELADFLGLLDQHRGLNYKPYWTRTDLTWDELAAALGPKKLKRLERRAAKGWEALAEAKEAGLSRRTVLRVLVLAIGLMPVFPSRVLIDMRNDVAVKHIEEAAGDVCAVWGAAHLPGIGKKLRASGWKLSAKTWDVAITGTPAPKHAADLSMAA